MTTIDSLAAENAKLEELDAAVERAAEDDDVSYEEYERLQELRDTARAEAKATKAKAEATEKAVQDLTAVAEEAKARAEAAAAAPQATAEQKFYAELQARTEEVEAREAAAAAPFAEDDDEALAEKLLRARAAHEDLAQAVKQARPGSTRAELAKREAEEAALSWAAIDAERLRRRAAADVERGFELLAHRDALARLEVEDRKALNEINQRSNIDPDTKAWAQQTYAERYSALVNPKPGQPLGGWKGPPDRYAAHRAEVEEKLREQMEAAKRDFVMTASRTAKEK